MTTNPSPTYKRALVTGASSGIGYAFAEALAANGSNLVLVARDERRLRELAAKLQRQHNITCDVQVADLSSHEGTRFIETFIEKATDIDLLVNNAGFGYVGSFATNNPDKYHQMIDLHVTAVMRLSRAAVPHMVRAKHGAVINVSSLSTFFPMPHSSVYAASKSFVNQFSTSLALEVANDNVRIMAVCPGFTHTEIFERGGQDKAAIPAVLFMSADRVARDSLRALARGTTIFVPGKRNVAMTWLGALAPRFVIRKVLLARTARAQLANR